jgi:hypothetical protein
MAYQFILEELDGASIGNDISRVFALTSGISYFEYKNFKNNSSEKRDALQEKLLQLTIDLAYDQNLMAKFRCNLADKIMRYYCFGKYSDGGKRINDLLEELGDILAGDKNVTPALSTYISAPKNAPIRHIHFTNKSIEAAKFIISLLREFTHNDDDSILKNALERIVPNEPTN